MAYFKQVDYLDMPGNTAFITAQANLLQFLGLGHDTTPVELDDFYQTAHVYETERNPWAWLTWYDSTIRIDLLERGWPSQSPAIVKFHCLSVEQPTTVIDGVQMPNFIDHYAVLINQETHDIIDSYDGEIKNGDPYGDPISYAVYTTPEYSQVAEPDPGFRYTWQPGDVMPIVAKRLGFTRRELMEHNNLDESGISRLVPGDVLHLPTAREAITKLEIRYQPLTDENGNPERREMHIQTIGGAKKWSFANVTVWDDIKAIGFYPEGTNVVVAGIAYVSVRELDGSITEAKYYMDSVSFGDYIQTNKVRYTIGFGHADMVLGRREAQKPVEQIPLVETKPIEPEVLPIPEPPKMQNSYKNTLQLLPEPLEVIATVNTETANARDEKGLFVWVYEHDNARRPGKLRNNREITIVATYEKQGVVYGIPKESYASNLWWGVPLDVLIPEQEVYNTDIDLVDRIATGRLTIYERIITEPLFRVVHNPRRRRWIFKHKHKE